jgi:hypothetical protein
VTVETDTFTPPPLRRRLAARGARVLDWLLPPLCIACRNPVGSHHALCPTCWKGVAFITAPVCERLGTPLAFDLGPGALSPAAIAQPPAFDRARAAFRFDDVGRALVHGLKYGDRLEVAVARSPPGWHGPGGSSSPMPTRWCRCRCTGRGSSPAASTRRRS